jgi:hypothetical protein
VTAGTPTLRRFLLVRTEDVSGTSGTGVVAEGVEWSDGTCGVHWLSQLACWSTYASMKVVEEVHGHDGRTVVQWIDEPGAAT